MYKSVVLSTHQTPVDNYLRNRKHVPCFYQAIATRVEVWGNKNAVVTRAEKRVFPQLFRVLPNFDSTRVSIKQLDYELEISIA